MSKKFRNKVCAYCGERASTSDHVIAREFFPEHLRGGLPKVPACTVCNGAKSRLEHYLVTILPLGGEHIAAAEGVKRLGTRLEKNARLERELRTGIRMRGDGCATLPFRREDLKEFSAFLVRGLVCHELGIVVDRNVYRVEGDGLRDGAQRGVCFSPQSLWRRYYRD
jgi:hypothetical protein